ncbi:hypothetical protein NKE62_09620 [Akkermansia sp. Marseille-P9185]|uniref:RHS repeat domain-containing protein n=1 Tax=Akkermansia massiliensis TaxID=2927224 RepID=UPI00209BEF0F|nr:RHS repeat-associated core domain-containing protein [Akkermansia massiliensis]MCO8187175.1 hypothetical protein [Akkermansia massiliensis]
MISLTTFRDGEGDITSDPSNRTDRDTTAWLYDEATGLELKKTYADGSFTSKTYDKFNRLETLTKARGIVTTYAYAPLTGELISVSHSDDTPGWKFTYNHIGQMTYVRDASGIRECSYDVYGNMIQDTSFGTVESSLQEEYDPFGRSAGCRLMLGTRTVQHSHLDYDRKGGIFRMNLEGLKFPFTWEYDSTIGLLNHLTYPNGMVRCNTYHPRLNLVAAIGYRKGEEEELATCHEYDYDALMRPIQRRDSWDSSTTPEVRDFTYNDRNELVEDRINREGSFSYQYDNIGNRKTAQELEKEIAYESNPLNQYTDIAGGEEDFRPVFDADGNQTKIKTSTGIWEVSYDANDRPVVFTSQDGRTIVTCGYDYQGRRFEKKVVINGTVSSHSRFLYRDYLQVAELDLTHPEPLLVKSYLWNPTDPTATRILMMTCWQENGMKVKEHLYFMHDALKNVTSIFDGQQKQQARYEYAPFGSPITEEGDMAQENKFRFSCEFSDDELGLVYYNYRHLNPADGRWINRDPIQEQSEWNLYGFVKNVPSYFIDLLGNSSYQGWALNGLQLHPSAYETVEYEISITYHALCQNATWWDRRINDLLANKTTKSPSDFNPNSECLSCQCIKKLTVIMHGSSSGSYPRVFAYWGDRRLQESKKSTLISNMFKNIKFCSECTLELRSCHLGESPILKARLEANTKCKVLLYTGKVNAFFPF